MSIKSYYQDYFTEWNTPNTYGKNYKEPPESSGVYLLVDLSELANIPRPEKPNFKILYVGSSKNLSLRYNKHITLRLMKQIYKIVNFYFKEEKDYRKIERQLIKNIQPEYNIQWR